jgi:hypothetical protein
MNYLLSGFGGLMGFPSGPILGSSCPFRTGWTCTGSFSDLIGRLGFLGSSLKITRALRGWLRTALAQSVGAGCCAGGTLSSQIRHIPGGGKWVRGTEGFGS